MRGSVRASPTRGESNRAQGTIAGTMRTLLLLAATVASLAAAEKIAGGPFVVSVTPRTATVVWLVESGVATIQAPGSPVRASPSLRVEKTTLSGLQPNTRYEYDISGTDPGKGSFKTPPAGPGSYKFVV